MLLLISVIAIALAAFFATLAWRLQQQDQLRSEARVAALSDAIDRVAHDTPAENVPVQEFLVHERPPVGRHGLMKVAIGFTMAVVVIIAVAMMSTSRGPRSGGGPTAVTHRTALELLSMRHEREGDTLTVTGLVRNSGSSAADRLIAVVFAFDRSGNFLASGRAPVDFVTMGPGDESPFRVSVPNVGEVGRYRVSFRNEAGVVRHVDRRQSLLARQGE